MSKVDGYRFIFQAQFNGDEFNTIPPLCTNDVEHMVTTIGTILRTHDSSFIYRVIDDLGRVIITNDPSGFENNPFDPYT